jgi:hypothetical protein
MELARNQTNKFMVPRLQNDGLYAQESSERKVLLEDGLPQKVFYYRLHESYFVCLAQ